MTFYADPDISLNFDADPDPDPDANFHFDADPDLVPAPHQIDRNLRLLVSTPSTAPLWAYTPPFWASTTLPPWVYFESIKANEFWLWCGTRSESCFSLWCRLRTLSKSWSGSASLLVEKLSSSDAKQEPNHEIENEDSRCCVPLRQSALYRLFKAYCPPHVDAKIHVFVYCPYLLVVKNTPPPPGHPCTPLPQFF